MPSFAVPNPQTKQFFVNDGPLEQELYGFQRPVSADDPIEEIRRRYRQDGHVLVKGLLPREDVLKARRKYFEMLSPTGFLKPDSDPVDGIYNTAYDALNFPGIGAGTQGSTDSNGDIKGPDPERARLFGDSALQAHHEDWYKHDLCEHPVLREFVARLTGWEEKTHGIRRTLLRNNTSGNKAIGVHYDQIFLRHGEDTFVTAWVPIGDIKLDGGGLIYLENGNKLGRQIEEDFMRHASEANLSEEQTKSAYNQNMMSGGLLADGPAAFARQHESRWLLAEYEAGDVVFHDPYAIHASTINHDQNNVIRLGTDIRFVDASKPWDTRWSNVLRPGDGL